MIPVYGKDKIKGMRPESALSYFCSRSMGVFPFHFHPDILIPYLTYQVLPGPYFFALEGLRGEWLLMMWGTIGKEQHL